MALWRFREPLVLASQSVARLSMLAAAGIVLEVLPANIDERAVEAKADAQDAGGVAGMLAREKARVVAAQKPGRLVLGADQTLALGTRRFSKPVNRAAAVEQLSTLRGRTHTLYSAVAVLQNGAVLFEHVDAARLTMRNFSDQFLNEYLDSAEDAVTGSVGAYQLEKLGVQLFERIEGDYFTILGLPLLPLLGFLRHEKCLAE